MTIATFVIPVSAKHAEMGIHHQAIESAKAQTIPSDVIVEIDHHKTGAAATRNRAMEKVKTPFAVFLDADDIVKPTFIETCLKHYKLGAYVYTDWVIDGLIVNTPDCLNMWDNGQEHIITTLLPTVAWRDTGGFDETLDTLEDEDFYRKLHAFGWCGVRCNEPLVSYRRDLGNSLVNKDMVESEVQKQRVAEKHALFTNRYKRFRMIQKDCGCGSRDAIQAINSPSPNDVLVEALYAPQRVEGVTTKRLYPRAGLRQPLWVDKYDAEARPDLFRIIGHRPESIAPDIEAVQRLTKEAIANEQVTQVNETPSASSVRQARQMVKATTAKLKSMTRAELLELAESTNIHVAGTGARGYIKRDDLLKALV